MDSRLGAGVLCPFVVERRDDSSGYRHRAASEMRRIRSRTGLNKSDFARALSKELAKNYLPHHVTRWEAGDQLPKTDIFLAALAVAGVDDPLCGEQAGTPSAVQRRLNAMQEQLAQLMAASGRQLMLPPAPEGQEFLSTQQAARALGVTRQTVYKAIGDGRLTAYRQGTRTVLLAAEVQAAREAGKVG